MFWSAPGSLTPIPINSPAAFAPTVLDVSGYTLVMSWSVSYLLANPTAFPLSTFLDYSRDAVVSSSGRLQQYSYDMDFGNFPGDPYVDIPNIPSAIFAYYFYIDGALISYDSFEQNDPIIFQIFLTNILARVPTGFGFDPAFTTTTRSAMPSPVIQLESRHIYTDKETQAMLINTKHKIPYSRLYENRFTFGPLDYKPILKGAVSIVSRVLDAIHPASRILWAFRNRTELLKNRYDNFLADASGSEFYNYLSLVIAGRTREEAWSPMVWGKLVALAKEDCDPGAGLGIMNWDLGAHSVIERHEPQGSVNFTTADRPTFLIDLSGAQLQYVDMMAVVDTWTTFTLEGGRGSINTYSV
jgi:hypothetical protein